MHIKKFQGQAGIFDVLFYVEKHGEATITKLVHDGRIVQSSCYNSLRRLIELGLIKMKEVPYKRGISKVYYLSPKGKKVLSLFYQIEDILIKK